jgi:hypothetical protein
MIVNDLIEAIFESMPMLVIQFVNNFMTNRWSNVFVISSFAASVAMVIISSLKLVIELYEYKINPIMDFFQYLEKNLKKEKRKE